MSLVATLPLPPTSEQGGYITPAAWEVPTALEQGAESGQKGVLVVAGVV